MRLRICKILRLLKKNKPEASNYLHYICKYLQGYSQPKTGRKITMINLSGKNNIIIRIKKSVFQIRIGTSPILMQMEYVAGHNKTETIIFSKLLSDLKFEHNKRFYLSHPALLCFRSQKSNSA